MSLISKPREFLSRPYRLLIIWGSIALFAFFLWSAGEARKNTTNRVVDWLPKGTQELQIFSQRYFLHFPEAEYLMVSWKGCNVADPNIGVVADILTSPPSSGNLPFFDRSRTTQSVIDNLSEPPIGLDSDGAKRRLAGWLIGQDLQTACLVFQPHPQNNQDAAAAVEFLFQTVEQITGLPRSDIYVAGTGIDSVAISEIASQSQRKLLPFFLLGSLILLLCCLRHFVAGFIVFWTAIINEELAGTVLFWSGAHVDSISMLNASLVYVLTISGSVHLMNYYRKTLAETTPGEEKFVPLQTFYKAVLPCSLATFTTILGMGSLGVSKMLPIQTFGIFASITLFLGTIWFFVYILSALQEKPIRRWFPGDTNSGSREPEAQPKGKFWERFGICIYNFRYYITVLTFAALIFFSFGIEKLHTSVTFHGLLPKDAKVLTDYQMLETQIGGLIPIEVVVQFPHNTKAGMLDQLYFVGTLVDELRQTDNVDAAISALSFLPALPSPTSGSPRAVGQRAAMAGLLERNQEQLQELRFFDKADAATIERFTGNRYSQADWGNYWRISLRVSTQKNLNYADVIAAVKNRAEKILHDNTNLPIESEKTNGVKIDVTGGMALVFKAQELLLWDLIYSFITAFALIAATMMIVLRGFIRGLLAMIPNIFPCVIVFGALGLGGIPVDMGSMMTASVALGISVDSTLHLLTWVNISLRQGTGRKEAVLFALKRCCAALFQTTIICGAGMLIFSWSDFVPVSRFAMLLCIILVISFLGAIVALPAILFSPLGRFFESDSKEKQNAWGL